MKTLKFTILPEPFSIHRLKANASLPKQAFAGSFSSITRTGEELSIVCPDTVLLDAEKSQPGYACLMVNGPLKLDQTGILAGISATLAKAEVPIFAVSTYNTDYILIPHEKLPAARQALEASGHKFTRANSKKAPVEQSIGDRALALLNAQVPLIRSLLVEKIGPATMATLTSKPAWAMAIGSLYEFLPAAIRIIIPRQVFVDFCLANLDKLIPAQAQPAASRKKAASARKK